MIFTYQFGRYRYKRLPFGAALAGDVFQRKIDKILKEIPNVFSIADDILVVGYEANGKDHDETLQRVLKICRQVNLKLKKDHCHYRCTSVPYFWSNHIPAWSETRSTEAEGTHGDAPSKNLK